MKKVFATLCLLRIITSVDGMNENTSVKPLSQRMNPETFLDISRGYATTHDRILVEPAQEIINGLSGMLRDIVVELWLLMKDCNKIRNIVGMTSVHYIWQTHSSFKLRYKIPYLEDRFQRHFLLVVGNPWIPLIQDQAAAIKLIKYPDIKEYLQTETGAVKDFASQCFHDDPDVLCPRDLFSSGLPTQTMRFFNGLAPLMSVPFKLRILTQGPHCDANPVYYRAIELLIDECSALPYEVIHCLIHAITLLGSVYIPAIEGENLLLKAVAKDEERFLAGTSNQTILDRLATEFPLDCQSCTLEQAKKILKKAKAQTGAELESKRQLENAGK